MTFCYQVMPPLSPEEYQALKADIAQYGVLVPIEVDEHGNILDGHHRAQACAELGLREYPRMVRQGLTEEQKRTHARKLNLLRRHLNSEQKRELIKQQLIETPHSSDHFLAAVLGVTDKTVRAVRESLEATSEIPKLERLVGADGKARPRHIDHTPADTTTLIGLNLPNFDVSLPAATPLAIHFSSEDVEWYTPVHIITRVRVVLGAIDLDPCSNSHTTPVIPAARHYTAQDNGLQQPWQGRIYMNSPYGRDIHLWIDKLYHEWQAHRTRAALALVPARTDTHWFRQLRDFPVCFLDGRLRFSGHENSAPFPSAMFYLGHEMKRFVAVFGDVGDVYHRIEV